MIPGLNTHLGMSLFVTVALKNCAATMAINFDDSTYLVLIALALLNIHLCVEHGVSKETLPWFYSRAELMVIQRIMQGSHISIYFKCQGIVHRKLYVHMCIGVKWCYSVCSNVKRWKLAFSQLNIPGSPQYFDTSVPRLQDEIRLTTNKTLFSALSLHSEQDIGQKSACVNLIT